MTFQSINSKRVLRNIWRLIRHPSSMRKRNLSWYLCRGLAILGLLCLVLVTLPHIHQVAPPWSHSAPGEYSGGRPVRGARWSFQSNLDSTDILFGIDLKDTMDMAIMGNPFSFLRNYKNPCWMEKLRANTLNNGAVSNIIRGAEYRLKGIKMWRASVPDPLDIPVTSNNNSSIVLSKKLQFLQKMQKNPLKVLGRTHESQSLFPYEQNRMLRGFFATHFSALRDLMAARGRDGMAWRMRCLPYFYLLGVTKSGTSDFFHYISSHPDVVEPGVKEVHYWNRGRYANETPIYGSLKPHATLSDYLDNFDNACHVINTSATPGGEQVKITGDASVGMFWCDNGWWQVSANAGRREPRVTIAMTLSAIQPSARLILLLREPADRVYSFYRMLNMLPSTSKDDFHRTVVNAIGQFESCLEKWGSRACAYSPHLDDETWPINIRGSLYSVFLRDWFEVFPRQQFLIIKSEDYYADRVSVLNQAAQFLDLDPFPEDIARGVAEAHIVRHNANNDPMLHVTRQLLRDFFRPFNEELHRMIGRQLWSY